MTEALIDSHCHLDLPAFDADREQVIERARLVGVKGFVLAATTRARWPALLQLAEDADDIYPTLGLHPYFLNQHQEADLEALLPLASQQGPVAIGEIGLDFMRQDLDRAKQLELFETQLQIARKLDLPVILHVRKAHDVALGLLKRMAVKGGICHAFNGSLQQASQYRELGFCLGFGGMLTYPRSTRLRKLARALPLEQIVLESDAPDMPGIEHRYQRNSPEYLPEVLTSLAELRPQSPAELALQTSANVRRVLELPELASG